MELKNVVILSGGMDSATVLGKVVSEYGRNNTLCVFFNYGQLTLEKERECINNLCKFYGVDAWQIKLDLLSSGLIEGKDEDFEVIGRNPLLVLYTLNYVRNVYKDKDTKIRLWVGIQGTDSTDYPDCTKLAVYHLKELVRQLGNNDLIVPFLENIKKEIIEYGVEIGVPYQFTWSCYTNNEKPCGKCPSCKLRASAFKAAGVEDVFI